MRASAYLNPQFVYLVRERLLGAPQCQDLNQAVAGKRPGQLELIRQGQAKAIRLRGAANAGLSATPRVSVRFANELAGRGVGGNNARLLPVASRSPQAVVPPRPPPPPPVRPSPHPS